MNSLNNRHLKKHWGKICLQGLGVNHQFPYKEDLCEFFMLIKISCFKTNLKSVFVFPHYVCLIG